MYKIPELSFNSQINKYRDIGLQVQQVSAWELLYLLVCARTLTTHWILQWRGEQIKLSI